MNKTTLDNQYQIFWNNIKNSSFTSNNPHQTDDFSLEDRSNYYLFQATFFLKSLKNKEGTRLVNYSLGLNPKNDNFAYIKETLTFFHESHLKKSKIYPNLSHNLNKWNQRLEKLRELYLIDAHRLAINYSKAIETNRLSLLEIIHFHLMRGISFYILGRDSDCALSLRLAFLLCPKYKQTIKVIDQIRDKETACQI